MAGGRTDTAGKGLNVRILVIDDDADVAEAFALMFASAGHEARWAVDGDGALSLASVEAPDVVLLDLHLAAGSSLPLLPRFGRARTYVITASRPSRDVTAEAARRGALAVLSKSSSPAELLARIESGR
jgi:DNA-binding response OmpR family regulator